MRRLFVLLSVSIGLSLSYAQNCEDGFRAFTDVRGEVCVPDVPERIVSTHDYNAAVQVLSLGGPLVGMASRGGSFAPDVAQFFDLSGIADVGNYTEPSVEAVLNLQPDLIVTYTFTDGDVAFLSEETLERLEQIAPVVTIDAFRPVEEVMADYAALLGDAATVSLSDLQAELGALLEDIRAVLGDEWAEVTAGFADFNTSAGTFQAWGPTRLVPLDILTRIGVTWVPLQMEAEAEGGWIGDVSLEQIGQFSGDLVLVNTYDNPASLNNALVQQLPAVQAGQIIDLDAPYAGSHYQNYVALAELMLEDLRAIEDFNFDLVEEDTANN